MFIWSELVIVVLGWHTHGKCAAAENAWCRFCDLRLSYCFTVVLLPGAVLWAGKWALRIPRLPNGPASVTECLPC